MEALWCLLIVILISGEVEGYPSFQQKIPNGAIVPNPCENGTLWPGVGHLAPQGKGPRNPFGMAFHDNNFTWNRTLCMADSDGDGMTNGQELGDPNCDWTPGNKPYRITDISHPGIPNPVKHDSCPKEFKCDAINQPDVLNVTLRLKPTPVPAKPTTYICEYFNLPTDGDYHMIASKPFMNNSAVLHHIVLFACDASEASHVGEAPAECPMVPNACFTFLNVWSVGLTGDCLNDAAGFRIGNGSNALRLVAMQLHWTNTENATNLTDSSGMTLYYTPKRRQYDAAVLLLGATDFTLPAGPDPVELASVCTPSCTQTLLKSPINVISGFSHMHHYGISEYVEWFRDGERVQYIIDDDTYDYNSPMSVSFPQPLVVQPGDSLRTTCKFKGGRNSPVKYGEETSDEMCFAFITYYPREALPIPYCMTNVNRQVVNCFGEHPVCQSSVSYDELVRVCSNVTSPCLAACEKMVGSHTCHTGFEQKAANYLTGLNNCLQKTCLKDDINLEASDDGSSRSLHTAYLPLVLLVVWMAVH